MLQGGYRAFFALVVLVVAAFSGVSVLAAGSWDGNIFSSLRGYFSAGSERKDDDKSKSPDAATLFNGPIIFQRGFSAAFDYPYNRGGQLYKVDPGSGTETLFGDGSQPNYSTDGSRLVFLLNAQLATTSSATYNPTPLTLLGGGSKLTGLYPKFSPDAANIVYQTSTVNLNGSTPVYHTRIIGGNCAACSILQNTQELNPTGTANFIFPSWHPTMTTNGAARNATLIFVRTNNTRDEVDSGNYTGDLFTEAVTINANGTITEGQRLAMTSSPAQYAFPVYSHDGSRIAFVKFSPDGSSSLNVMNAVPNSTPTALYSFPADSALATHHPSWSPDDTRIAFSDTNLIYQVNTSGTPVVTPVTAYGNAAIDLWPSWAPGTGPTPSPTPTPTPNPVPAINTDGTGLSPSAVVQSVGAFTLTVNGTNFVSSSVVNFNGTARTTTFVSQTKVTAQITAADSATLGTFPITVVNPAPGGGTSNAVNFTVSAITIGFDGRTRDRVSKSETGLCFNTRVPPSRTIASPICDGDSDGVFSLAISPLSASKLITKVDLVGPTGNRWDTVPGNQLWVVGVARSIDADFENQADGSLPSVPVSNQGTFKLFVPDSNPSSFVAGKNFTLNVTFGDGSTLTAATTIAQSPTWDTGVTLRGPTANKIAGDRFTYTASVQNYGTALATNLRFSAALPANIKLVGLESSLICPDRSKVGLTGPTVTCNFNQLDPGQAQTIVLTVQAVSPGQFTTTASLGAQVPEPASDPHANSASVQSSIVKPVDVAVAFISAPARVGSLATINYAIDVANNSSENAQGVVLTVPIPNNAVFDSTDNAALGCAPGGGVFTCTFTSALAGNQTLHIRFAFRPLHPNEASVISTTAHVSTTSTDSDLLNNDASSPQTSVIVASDLSLTMNGPTQVVAGQNVTYAIRATNNGPSKNTETIVYDPLPANTDFVSVTPGPGSSRPQCGLNLIAKVNSRDPDVVECFLGPLEIGQTYQVNLTLRPRVSGTITNSARVTLPSAILSAIFGIPSGDLDNNEANNVATFSTEACVAGNASAPTFQIPNPEKTASVSTKYSYRMRATSNQGRVKYTLTQGPAGMDLKNMDDGTALLTWTPDPAQVNTIIPVQITATTVRADGSPLCNSSMTKSFSITVISPPPPGGYCIANGAVKICSDAIVPVAGMRSVLGKKIAAGELKPEDYPSGTYQLGGNTKLGNYLLFTGNIMINVDRVNAKLTASVDGGSLILQNVPLVGDKILWSTTTQRSFTFDADGAVTNFLSDQADALKIAGCTIHITSAHLLLTDPNDLGITVNGDLVLPDTAGIKGLHSSFQNLTIRQKSGIHFTGDIAVPNINLGAVEIKGVTFTFVASPDGMHDVFTGKGQIAAPGGVIPPAKPFFTLDSTVQLIGGKLDSVCAAASLGATGVPIPPFFNLTRVGGGIVGLQGGPVPANLCGIDTAQYGIPQGFSIFVVGDVTIGDPAIAKIIQLSNAGFIYTTPNKFKVITDLNILTAPLASAVFGIEAPYNFSVAGRMSIIDKNPHYPVFTLGSRQNADGSLAPLLSAGFTSSGGQLHPFMSAGAEAKVQIPPMPNPELPQPAPFLYGLAGAAGVKFPLPIASASVGFDFPPGAFNANVSVPIINTVSVAASKGAAGLLIEFGKNYASKSPASRPANAVFVAAEETASAAKNPSGPRYYPGSEGLHIPQGLVPNATALGTYDIPVNTPKLAVDLAGGTATRFDLIRPDGITLTPDNAFNNDSTFLQNADSNESYFVVNNPMKGTWTVQAEDGTQGPFVLNVFGGNSAPVMTSVTANKSGNTVVINYNADDSDDEAPVSLYYSKSNTDFNGTQIITDLPKSVGGSYSWNVGDGSVPPGDYYVYAMISDGKNAPQAKYASTKVTVTDPLAPATPANLSVKPPAGNSLVVSWDAVTDPNLVGYAVQYAVDAGTATVLDQNFDAGTQTSVQIPRLLGSTGYRVSVVALSMTADAAGNAIMHLSQPAASQVAVTGVEMPPIVQITSPNGGEKVTGNDEVTVSWNLAQGIDIVSQMVELSTDDGATWTPLDQTLDASVRNYIWHVPTTIRATSTRLRVTAIDSSGNTGSDTSDAAFTVTALPVPITLSGRVLTPDFRALKNARVTLTNSVGDTQTVITNSFGIYTFASVPSEDTYTVRAFSKLYRFSAKSVQPTGNLTVSDFVGLE